MTYPPQDQYPETTKWMKRFVYLLIGIMIGGLLVAFCTDPRASAADAATVRSYNRMLRDICLSGTKAYDALDRPARWVFIINEKEEFVASLGVYSSDEDQSKVVLNVYTKDGQTTWTDHDFDAEPDLWMFDGRDGAGHGHTAISKKERAEWFKWIARFKIDMMASREGLDLYPGDDFFGGGRLP